MSEPGSSYDTGEKPIVRRIRIHKVKPSSKLDIGVSEKERNASLDRSIAELIPGIADLSVSAASIIGPSSTATEIRKKQLSREEAHRAEITELGSIFDMSRPNPVDNEVHEGPWSQELRPRVRRVQLSPYQYEMINYQRMVRWGLEALGVAAPKLQLLWDRTLTSIYQLDCHLN